MASKVSGMIEYIKTDNGNNLAIASTAYGYCSTLADEPIKTVEMTGFYLYEGVTIHIKFENANTANNPQLKFNNETDDKAKPLISYDAQPIRPSDNQALGWMPGAVLTLTYDGESWINTSVGEHTHAALAPLLSKTYDSYTISANNKNNGVLYFGHVIIDNTSIWSLPWSVHYKLYVTTTEENTQGVYDCRFIVNGGTANYYILNNFYSTSYYPIYSHSLLFPKNGYSEQGAYLGMRIYSAYASTTLARTYKIEILETSNCTVVFNNDLIRYSEIFNSTYFTFGEYNGTANGLQETGDANTNTINVLQRTNNYLDNGSSLYLHGYPLFGLDANNKAQAISTYSEGYTKSTTNINVKGARIYNSNGFDWTKGLYYNGSSTVYAPNALLNFSPYTSYSNFDFRYSDNVVASDTINNLGLINKMPIYLRGTIEADGLFHLAPITVSYNNDEYERAWTQTIPSVENENGNFVYWFVGYPYYNGSYADSLYQAILYEDNKLYWYKDNKLKEYIPEAVNSLKVNNHTVLSDVPANATFTDTNKYHTSGSWNGLTYTATAVNNADELKFTIPDNYGDTKNPYASKTKNYILAAPSNANGIPSFRALVEADIPNLNWSKITNKPDEDLFVKKRTLPTISEDLDLVKLLPGIYNHTSNVSNTLPLNYGTILNIRDSYRYGALIDAGADDVLYYRAYYYNTDEDWQWRTARDWQVVAHAIKNANGVGSSSQPVYMTNKGVITPITSLDSNLVKSALGTTTTTAKKFLKDTGNWAQVDWEDLTGKPSSETLRDQLFPLTTYTKTLTLTTEWQNVGITGEDLDLDGTYIIQLFLNSTGTDSLGSYNERYSGIMSWYKSMTNSNNMDEIVLHRAGYAPNNNCIYLRTKRVMTTASPNTLQLQIKASQNTTIEATLNFKFRWMLD